MLDNKITIQTDRLILRRYCKDDLQDLFEYLSDEKVVKYEPYKPMSLAEVTEELDKRISTDLEGYICVFQFEHIFRLTLIY